MLPHVSSVTLACSRVGWAVQDTEVISLVTAQPHTAVRRGGQAVVLSRDGSTPAALARAAQRHRPRRFARSPCSNNSAVRPNGAAAATAREWATRPPGDVDELNVIAVRYLPDERVSHVLPDDAFAHDGQITKQAIRAVTLAALAPRPGELLWDVGCRLGQHRGRVVPQRARLHGGGVRTRRAAPQADRRATPWRSASASRCAARTGASRCRFEAA